MARNWSPIPLGGDDDYEKGDNDADADYEEDDDADAEKKNFFLPLNAPIQLLSFFVFHQQ